jgi:uncharacterized C2H2 Zn-finger protein
MYSVTRRKGIIVFKCSKCGFVVIVKSEQYGKALIESHIRDVHNVKAYTYRRAGMKNER